MASGNQFLMEIMFFFFKDTLGSESFLLYCKFIFAANPLFCLVETNFLASGNNFVPISQIFFLLEAVFPSPGNIFETNPLL